MNHDEFKGFFAKHFAIVHLDVMERGEKKSLENAGGAEILAELGGAKAGLPFFAFLDAEGKLLINSIRPGEKGGNIGHPMQPEEVDHFMAMVKKAAPKAAAGELAKLDKFLRNQKSGG